MPSALHVRQVLFLRCLSMLVKYAMEHGWELTLGEGYIKTPRKIRGGQGTLCGDGEHMPGSLHYLGLAQDLNLFVAGEYVTQSDHPTWVELGEYWESLDPLCRWGGRFKPADGNHVSITYQGKA